MRSNHRNILIFRDQIDDFIWIYRFYSQTQHPNWDELRKIEYIFQSRIGCTINSTLSTPDTLPWPWTRQQIEPQCNGNKYHTPCSEAREIKKKKKKKNRRARSQMSSIVMRCEIHRRPLFSFLYCVNLYQIYAEFAGIARSGLCPNEIDFNKYFYRNVVSTVDTTHTDTQTHRHNSGLWQQTIKVTNECVDDSSWFVK